MYSKSSKPVGYWIKENCIKDALNYKTKSEWENAKGEGYNTARKNGWLKECTKHMKDLRGYSSKKWSFELCKKVAEKYNTKTEFIKKNMDAYLSATRNGWLSKICVHMKRPKNIFWNREKTLEVSLKCNSITEFKLKYGGAYKAARKNKWLSECKAHMEILGTRFKRLIYSFEFSDKSVYVGLTYNPTKRKQSHLSDKDGSQVYKHIQQTGLQPEFKKLTEFLDKDIASKKEGEFLEKYKNEGWKILNKYPTGVLGGNVRIWTKENCLIDASKYTSKTKWIKNSYGAYLSAKRNNWLNECKFQV
jgi:hypothetical protein